MGYSRQDAISKVYGWFILDRRQPLWNRYVDPEHGLRCAVGCLFSDALAAAVAERPLMNHNCSAAGLWTWRTHPQFQSLWSEMEGLDEPFLTALQQMNDQAILDATVPYGEPFHSLFESRLRVLAANLGLTLPDPEPCVPLPLEAPEINSEAPVR